MNQKSEDGKYISEVDVTRDGKPERIVIDAEAAGNPKTGEEPTVQVFSGETGKMIWSLPVNTVHAVLLISTEGGTLRIGDGSTRGGVLFYDPEAEIREMKQ